MAYGTINADLIATSTTGGTLGAGNATGFKNRIINGNMMIDQRNAGASYTQTGGNAYTVDRWVNLVTGSVSGKLTYQQNAGSVTPPAGFAKYLGVTSTSAYSIASGDIQTIAQPIEGFNTSDLDFGTANAKTITVSFWVRSSLTGTFGGSILNSAGNYSYPFTYTISSANTWEYKTITIAGPTAGTWVGATNGVGLYLIFSLGTGSTYTGTSGSWSANGYYGATGQVNVSGTNGATWYITGVQLEVGASASSFEVRDYGRELILCQRYYQKFQGVGPDDNWGCGVAYTATNGLVPFMWSPQMRTSVTATSSGTFETVGNSTVNSATITFSDLTSFSLQIGVSTSSLTAGGACLLRTATSTSSIAVSAEL